MAEGYATARPPVHPRVVDRIAAWLGERKRRALDLGCGSGLSTRPLLALADSCVGVDPVAAMVSSARVVAPSAWFVVASAESLPFRAGAFDVITAAGSLNYTVPGQAFSELARVLAPRGIVAAYDFSPGRAFRDGDALGQWFHEFELRYPWPAGNALQLNPEILGTLADPLRVAAHEHFEIDLALTPEFYLEYVLTETNVSRAAEPPETIREWCRATLTPVFAGQTKAVVFRGYIAYLKKEARP
jgi:SAM-dependent methyltransferase